MTTSTPSPLTASTFDYVCKLVYEQSGIALSADKHYLVQLRLGPLAKAAGYPGINEYVTTLQRPSRTPQHTAVIEAMTTNETSFFRDVSPFDALRHHLLPEF